ncbi:MAG: transposase [Candidatus Uhrbacteria bacterium]|nr:transposase [Candidatus Uhrbacteria bacterium]
MARPLRIEYPGALYHVTSRGNKKQDIFLTQNDRFLFLLTLNKIIKTHNWICHAYCLMNNHYHLLIETPDANLSSGMHDLNGEYTQIYNRIHQAVGHILQGRYKAFVIEKETYFLEVARYIVLNPVRAGFVKHPKDWMWSSFNSTRGSAKSDPLLDTSFLLSQFGRRKAQARQKYTEFVLNGIQRDSPLLLAEHNLILGSPQFVHRMWEENADAEEITDVVTSERMIARPTLQDLFVRAKDVQERDSIILFARMRCGYSVSQIAKHLRVHRTTVSKIINKK